ncbi:MAG: hypothetical protein H7A54_13640 [Akkermansiaceae bacterium]|nr:hypothetical protein [Akkermansiaceae bacterium]
MHARSRCGESVVDSAEELGRWIEARVSHGEDVRTTIKAVAFFLRHSPQPSFSFATAGQVNQHGFLV